MKLSKLHVDLQWRERLVRVANVLLLTNNEWSHEGMLVIVSSD